MALRAETFLEAGLRSGFCLYTGVPCSYLKPFINYVIDSPRLHYVGAANEGDAVAIAAGAEVGGRHAVVMFQNSGFGNTVNPLTSLNAIFEIPVLLIATLRGEPGGPHDEPQHELMGQITTDLFDLLRIPWEYFPVEEAAVAPTLGRAVRHMTNARTPFALVMRKDAVEPYALKSRATPRIVDVGSPDRTPWPAAPPSRTEVLRVVQASTSIDTDALVATTGYTGRELYALSDVDNQLYMVGSMGCASSFGLGLAWARPDKRVVVLDGDGAALMRMGNFATLGYERPTNLVHVLLDNEAHDSTGGQSTVSHSVDFCAIARASGYPVAARVASLEELGRRLAAPTRELTFLHVKTRPGAPPDLPRPRVTPIEVKERLERWLGPPPPVSPLPPLAPLPHPHAASETANAGGATA